MQFFFQKICIYQKKAVPLHQKSEKDVLTILRRKRTGQRWGATREGYGAVKHIPQACGRKNEEPYRFRAPRFFVSLGNYETNIFATLGYYL